MKSAITRINAGLKKLGREERLVRGRGYYYLFGGEASSFPRTMLSSYRIPPEAYESTLREVNKLFADAVAFTDKPVVVVPLDAYAIAEANAKRVYPDTRSGAREALKDMLEPRGWDRVKDAKFFPDPVVEGVWGVDDRDGGRIIIYLAGYKNPFGEIRKTNDFEVGEKP